ncbi:MAG: hypothetical protein U9P10_10365, partial [Thermodesulfobacteriota bacterium]|nr:hypothetical protein [Thermodesulfobacteriota bacterium]
MQNRQHQFRLRDCRNLSFCFLLLFFLFMYGISPQLQEAKASDLSFRFVTKYPAQEKPPLAIAPYHIAFDSNGNLYAADPANQRIVSLNPDGSFRLAWGRNGRGDGKFRYPTSVAVSADGRVYVIDRGNARVQVFDTQGKFQNEIKSSFDFSLNGGVNVGYDG